MVNETKQSKFLTKQILNKKFKKEKIYYGI